MSEPAASLPKEETRGPGEATTSAKKATTAEAEGQKQTASFQLKEGPGQATASTAKEAVKSDAGDGSRDHEADGERWNDRGNRKPRGSWKSSRGRGGWRDKRREGWDQQDGNRSSPYHHHGGSHPYGGNRYRGESRHFQHKEQRKAEDLQKASLAQKDDKVVSFDCRVRPKSELTDWLRHNKPTSLKRSEKIGYIAVISQRCTSLTEKKFTMTPEDLEQIHAELIADWERLTQDPSAKITYNTIMQLAKKHKLLGGKWLCSFEAPGVDDTWVYLASAVAATDNPMPCLAVKVTPHNDTEGVNSFGRRSHMCSVYTEDFTDMDNVFAVEKCLRAVPIKKDLTYKPDIFTALGIYRNNKYNLKPVIYHSVWHSMSSTSVTDSVFDMDWSYQGGSGDLRVARHEARKQAKDKQTMEDLEFMIDSVIDRVLGKAEAVDKPQEAEAKESEQGTGGEAAKDSVADKDADDEKPAGQATSANQQGQTEEVSDAAAVAKKVEPVDAPEEGGLGEGEKGDQQKPTAKENEAGGEDEVKKLVDEAKKLAKLKKLDDKIKMLEDKIKMGQDKEKKLEDEAKALHDEAKAAGLQSLVDMMVQKAKAAGLQSLVDMMVQTNIAQIAVGESGVVDIPEVTAKNVGED